MGSITLLRHGQTEANAKKLLQGRMNPALDPVGVAQAKAAATAIGRVDQVISSPLQRAQETASYLDAQSDGVVLDPRWIELDYGDFDGQPLSSVPAETWAAWREDINFRPPNGETLAELGARVSEALEELAAGPSMHTVVVSHVSPIKAAVAWALGVPDEISWRLHLNTASITRVEFRGNTPVLQSFNDIAHHSA